MPGHTTPPLSNYPKVANIYNVLILFPDSGVGFKVAGDTNIQHLVLQVHYMHRTPEPDFSGVDIESTNQPFVYHSPIY